MRRRIWIIAAAPVVLLIGAEPGWAASSIEQQVERLADQHDAEIAKTAPPANSASGDKTDCRWVTQSIEHQGVTHTRRIRTCEHPSWWSEWLGKARRGG